MNILDKYIPKQTTNRPYKVGSTAIFMVAIVFLLASPANESGTQSPAPEKWVAVKQSPKQITLTHKDGRKLDVYLVARSETDIVMQRTGDYKMYQIPINTLSEKDQKMIEDRWDPKVQFTYYKVKVVYQSCSQRRSCR